ncbi:AAA domain-containing protein [Massilia norwichensis]|uniref:AAA domain-containing protein n=1 Tax=Massilia norwichensis TaxID=1442366 RepID=A0ABT2AEM6_9BURK|nr:AAA domain-containing protein [Massilia norwichensis]MCS0592597.1 AAA domain-containing protein [Massilia norwichensis]
MSETTHAPSFPAHLYWDIRFTPPTFPNTTAVASVDKLYAKLSALRKRFGNALLPGASTPQDMLARFCTLLFPDGRLSDYLISNITVKADPYLLIRPQALLPSHTAEWPEGLTLAAKGYVERRTGMFRLMDISDMTDLPARPFERTLRAIPMRGSPRHGQSAESGLNAEWLATLPLISKDTAEALKQWTDYLDWKQKLVQAGITGVRYLSRSLQDDGTWRFVIAVPEASDGPSIDRLLRSDDLSAYNLDYSTDPWTFTYRENSKARAQALGEAAPGKKAVTIDRKAIPQALVSEEMPAARFQEVSYQLEETAYEKFVELVEADGAVEAVKKFENTLPATGFLAVSAVGDLALIRRQREELQRLQRESGFAPFVSAYLFDITQARAPDRWHEIGPQDWLRGDMNPDQRKAVQMMISTPDLSLIQGPPGTGKTTMIAEATYQLVRQGKTVLVASQANLAVDNALKRLGDTPVIRALRLGIKADKESPFVPEHALGSYYRSVAKFCRQQHLDKWEAMQSEARSLDAWIEATELVASDLRQVEERIAQGRALKERSTQEQQGLQQRLEAAGSERERLDDAASFLDHLTSAQSDWAGSLPDTLRQAWHAAVGRMQISFAEAGLNTGRALGWYDPAASRMQAAMLFSAARTCSQLLDRLPSLRNELRRLSQLKSEQLMSAETEALVATLTAERTRLWVLAEDGDDAAFAQAKEIAQQLRSLSRDSALSRDLYESVFEPTHAARLLAANATRTAVLEALQRAVAALRRAMPWRHAAFALGRTQLAAAIASAADTTNDQRQLALVGRGIRELEHQLAEDAKRRTRHLADLGAQLELDELPTDWRAACATALEAKRTRQTMVGGGLRQTASLRNDWGPVLQAWTASLDEQGNAAREAAPAVRYLTDAYIESANVVGITCSERRSTLTEAKHDAFDVAIVDEVSKATPPELLMCVSMARTAILVGDHRQLPPVFKEGISAEQYLEQVEDQDADASDDPASDSALTRDNLERFGDMVSASLFKRHFENAPATLKAFLFTQYRMHPQIMEVVNAFYEGKLTCGLSDPDGLNSETLERDIRQHRLELFGPDRIAYLKPDQHVLWIDSGKAPNGDNVFERRAGASGKVNDTEAALIAKVLVDLDQACEKQGYGSAGKARKEVGIVTFYAKQIRAIKDAINALVRTRGPFVAIKVDVNTADRYQGQERPIVIVSLVRSPPHKLSKRANTAQFERINVAFSRAQELLVVLGSERVFRSYEIKLPHLDRPGHSTRAVYGQIISEIELNGGFKHARQLLDQTTFEQLLPAGASGRTPPSPANAGRKARRSNDGRIGGAR